MARAARPCLKLHANGTQEQLRSLPKHDLTTAEPFLHSPYDIRVHSSQAINLVRQAEQLFVQKRLDDAADLASRAAALAPDLAEAHQLLGMIGHECGEIPGAIRSLHRALELRPDLELSHNCMGRCHFLLGDLDSALHHYERAIFLKPDFALAHSNRAVVLLKAGRFHEGWLEYEWRWKAGMAQRPDIPGPRWDGSPLKGKSILIHTEQGFGDAIQFVRLFPELKRRGGRVVFACQTALLDLLQNVAGVDDWFPIDRPADINFHVHASMMSLPGLLDLNETSIPGATPYLIVNPARIAAWRQRLAGLKGFKVGLAWQGNPNFIDDRFRSIPLASFARLGRIPGVTFISLQYGAGASQMDAVRDKLPLTMLEGVNHHPPLLDFAAIIENLDLVISSDTVIAHLAGALGREVWVPLSMSSDWRWLVGREDSPWYPTMRLFRQTKWNDWDDVLDRIAEALQSLLTRTPHD